MEHTSFIYFLFEWHGVLGHSLMHKTSPIHSIVRCRVCCSAVLLVVFILPDLKQTLSLQGKCPAFLQHALPTGSVQLDPTIQWSALELHEHMVHPPLPYSVLLYATEARSLHSSFENFEHLQILLEHFFILVH